MTARAVLAIILAGYLLVLIDVSILMAALPSIRADLGFSDTGLSWAQNADTLTFGGLLLLGAGMGARRRSPTARTPQPPRSSTGDGDPRRFSWPVGTMPVPTAKNSIT
jgi:MFS family permease